MAENQLWKVSVSKKIFALPKFWVWLRPWIEAQFVQKLKNNEAQPRFTGSYKKACMFS